MTLYASSSRKRPGEGKDAGEGDVNVRFARVSRGLMNRTDTSRENERRGSNISMSNIFLSGTTVSINLKKFSDCKKKVKTLEFVE